MGDLEIVWTRCMPLTADHKYIANILPQMTDELGQAMSAVLGDCQNGSKCHGLSLADVDTAA